MSSTEQEFLRLTEETLKIQAELARSRDQKCISFAALAAAATAFAFGKIPDGASISEPILGAAVFFAIASLLLALCALPQTFHGFAYRFSTLNTIDVVALSYDQLLVDLAAKNDMYINSNSRQARLISHFARFGFLIFGLGMLLVIIAVFQK